MKAAGPTGLLFLETKHHGLAKCLCVLTVKAHAFTYTHMLFPLRHQEHFPNLTFHRSLGKARFFSKIVGFGKQHADFLGITRTTHLLLNITAVK